MTAHKEHEHMNKGVEEINKILSNSIQQYISDNKISILGNPIPVENKIDFINNTEYTFEFELGLQPEINLSTAEKSKIDYLVIKPEKKEIDEHILSLQKRYGSVTSFDDMQNGDMINVSLQELDDDGSLKTDGVVSETSILIDKISDKNIKNKFLKLKKSDKISVVITQAFTNTTDLISMLKISKEKFDSINPNFMCTIKDISRLIPSEINSDFFKKAYPDKDIKTT